MEKTIKKITERIEELESREAFHELTIETLNEIILVQQKEIDQLKRIVHGLSEHINGITPEESPITIDEKPPHY